MKRATLLLVLLLQGCAATPDDDDAIGAELPRATNPACPPLPTLPPGATRFEERLNNAIVRELYAQCAESKR